MSVVIHGIDKPKSCEECYEKTHCFGTGSVDREGCTWCGLSQGYVGTNEIYNKCYIMEIGDDFVPVTRCSKCVHGYYADNRVESEISWHCWLKGIDVKEDGFCESGTPR